VLGSVVLLALLIGGLAWVARVRHDRVGPVKPWFDAVTLPEQLRALVQRRVQDIKPQTPRKRFGRGGTHRLGPSSAASRSKRCCACRCGAHIPRTAW
jgi:hypothetical protein